MERHGWPTAVVYQLRDRDLVLLDHVASLGVQAVQLVDDEPDDAFARECRDRDLEVVPHRPVFDLHELGWSGPQWLDVVDPRLGEDNAWTLSGRLGPPPRATALTLLMLALPGAAYLYMGEELGLPPAHTPMPWTSVQEQEKNPTSTLNLYRAALKVRRAFAGETEVEVGLEDGLFWIARESGWVSATNFGARPVDVPVEQVFMSTVPLLYGQLPGDATAWLHP